MDIELIFESYDYPYAIREGGGRLNVYVDRGRGKQNVYACLQGGREGSVAKSTETKKVLCQIENFEFRRSSCLIFLLKVIILNTEKNRICFPS